MMSSVSCPRRSRGKLLLRTAVVMTLLNAAAAAASMDAVSSSRKIHRRRHALLCGAHNVIGIFLLLSAAHVTLHDRTHHLVYHCVRVGLTHDLCFAVHSSDSKGRSCPGNSSSVHCIASSYSWFEQRRKEQPWIQQRKSQIQE